MDVFFSNYKKSVGNTNSEGEMMIFKVFN